MMVCQAKGERSYEVSVVPGNLDPERFYYQNCLRETTIKPDWSPEEHSRAGMTLGAVAIHGLHLSFNSLNTYQ